jgi:hypothetical protein
MSEQKEAPAPGATFNISQDFREQDPTRIAAAFGEGLARAAEQPTWFGGEDESGPSGVGAPLAPESSESEPGGGIPLLFEEEEPDVDAATKAAAGVADVDGEHFVKLPPPRPSNTAPDWAKIPTVGVDGKPFRFPRGVEVFFVRIRGHLTAARQKGDRILVIWGLSDGDEKLAFQRSISDSNRAITELAKQSVRAIDGHAASWDGRPGPGNVDQLWREIGGKGRGQLVRLYSQLHVYDAAEQADFFENCVASVATG